MTETTRDALIAQHLPLVHSIANRFAGLATPALDREDLVQEGILGLLHAADRYDPERGVKFLTYATWWVRAAIGRAIEELGRTIRLPSYALDQHRQMTAAQQRAEEEGRAATLEEMADAAGVTPERALNILQAVEPPLSLDALISEDDPNPLIERIAAPPPPHDPAGIGARVDALPPGLRDVIRARYWQELSLTQAAQALGLSREGVRRREHRALRKLREMMEAGEPEGCAHGEGREDSPVEHGEWNCGPNGRLP